MTIEVRPSEFDSRVSKTRARMKQTGVDALFIYSDEYHPGYSMYYTNLERSTVLKSQHTRCFCRSKARFMRLLGI